VVSVASVILARTRCNCYITGYTGGSHYTHQGSAASYLCLPSDPQWLSYVDGVSNKGRFVYGAEYETDARNAGIPPFASLHEHDVPCAVCHSTTWSTSLMIPGRTSCYGDWHLEYNGYLMSGHYTHKSATEFVCVDKTPDSVPGSRANKDGKLFYFVEAVCGSLPCPPYVDGREMACVVCTM
jgi:hypothetical protein